MNDSDMAEDEEYRTQLDLAKKYLLEKVLIGYPDASFVDIEDNLEGGGFVKDVDEKEKDYTTLGIKKNIDDSLFSEYKFKKQVSTKIHMHNTDVTVIGSLWELGFSYDIDEAVQIFALDCGLGERNSLGFGFVNELHNP